MDTIKTGIKSLDKKRKGGLRGGSLTVIAGRPGMGKSSLAFQIAGNIAECGKRVLLFSLEMDEPLVRKRMSMQGFEAYENNVIVYDEPAVSVEYITQKATGLENIDAIFVDYIQLMKSSAKTDSRVNELSDISRSLKSLAIELNVPVIALSQLSRAIEKRDDKRPMMSDLRDSGAIEQDADVIMFIYRDEYYNKDSEKRGISEVIISKQRNGPLGTVELVWLPEYTMFKNKVRDQKRGYTEKKQ